MTASTAEQAWQDWQFGGALFCVCGCGGRANEWHHIFEQDDYPDLADERANIVPVRKRCHERHTNAFKRLPRSAARRAERLATTPAMQDYLDRYYTGAKP